MRLNLPALSFTGILGVVAVALFGLVPALRASGVELAGAMRAHARTLGEARGGRVPVGRILIAAQVALSLVLVVSAALLVRNLRNLQTADPGLDRDHLLIVELNARDRGYAGDRLSALTRELTTRLAAIPGVAAVSYSENGIFSGTESGTTFQISGFQARQASDTSAAYDQIGPGYVRAIGGRLLEGRDVTMQDVTGAPLVAVINETMARFYFPGASAIGRTIRFDDATAAQIIGVIADTKDHSLEQAPVRRIYLAYEQQPVGAVEALNFEVRTIGAPGTVAAAVRREIAAVDALLPINSVAPLSLLMHQSIQADRLVTRLASGFGVLALLLAALGLYGVMTYAVTRRTGEIGLRAALGAQRGDIVHMVLGDAWRLVALGVAASVPLVFLAMRLLRNQLFGVSVTDPAAITGAVLVLIASATLAALLPALRAARVGPLVALRSD